MLSANNVLDKYFRYGTFRRCHFGDGDRAMDFSAIALSAMDASAMNQLIRNFDKNIFQL